MAYLEVLNGPEVGQKVPISQDTFFLGRDPNNHLVLSDRTVSRKHAVINRIEGEFAISDLKSLKGLLINGSKLNEANLEDGDEIAVGAVRLRFYVRDDGKIGPVLKPRRKGFRLLFLGCLIAVLLGGGAYFLLHQTDEMKQHYLLGISLFNNNHDIEGAKREWEKVLELDPKRKSVYSQKALKLLDDLGDK